MRCARRVRRRRPRPPSSARAGFHELHAYRMGRSLLGLPGYEWEVSEDMLRRTNMNGERMSLCEKIGDTEEGSTVYVETIREAWELYVQAKASKAREFLNAGGDICREQIEQLVAAHPELSDMDTILAPEKHFEGGVHQQLETIKRVVRLAVRRVEITVVSDTPAKLEVSYPSFTVPTTRYLTMYNRETAEAQCTCPTSLEGGNCLHILCTVVDHDLLDDFVFALPGARFREPNKRLVRAEERNLAAQTQTLPPRAPTLVIPPATAAQAPVGNVEEAPVPTRCRSSGGEALHKYGFYVYKITRSKGACCCTHTGRHPLAENDIVLVAFETGGTEQRHTERRYLCQCHLSEAVTRFGLTTASKTLFPSVKLKSCADHAIAQQFFAMLPPPPPVQQAITVGVGSDQAAQPLQQPVSQLAQPLQPALPAQPVQPAQPVPRTQHTRPVLANEAQQFTPPYSPWQWYTALPYYSAPPYAPATAHASWPYPPPHYPFPPYYYPPPPYYGSQHYRLTTTNTLEASSDSQSQ
eukprot:TRINITY_DN4997_c0_g1_i2.p1 TRINITY_DN4997_c0_g1~~TRINITY_DN4997_c0_g1_i2.p1  ORF type:complete len:524 (-),score=37.22 TRINITY_DN4997_c0_g1_i2:29-1600(-)